MKKMNYTEPQLDVVKFCAEDILMASSEIAPGYNPDAEQGGGWVVGPNSSGNDQGFAL